MHLCTNISLWTASRSTYNSVYPNAATADHKHHSNWPSVQFITLLCSSLGWLHLPLHIWMHFSIQIIIFKHRLASLAQLVWKHVSEFFAAIPCTVDLSNPLSECSQKALPCRHAASFPTTFLCSVFHIFHTTHCSSHKIVIALNSTFGTCRTKPIWHSNVLHQTKPLTFFFY